MIFSNFQIIVIFQIYCPWRDNEVARFSSRQFICISLTNKVSNVFASFFKPFQQVARYSEVASLLEQLLNTLPLCTTIVFVGRRSLFFTHNTFLYFYFPIASYIINLHVLNLSCPFPL